MYTPNKRFLNNTKKHIYSLFGLWLLAKTLVRWADNNIWHGFCELNTRHDRIRKTVIMSILKTHKYVKDLEAKELKKSQRK